MDTAFTHSEVSGLSKPNSIKHKYSYSNFLINAYIINQRIQLLCLMELGTINTSVSIQQFTSYKVKRFSGYSVGINVCAACYVVYMLCSDYIGQ